MFLSLDDQMEKVILVSDPFAVYEPHKLYDGGIPVVVLTPPSPYPQCLDEHALARWQSAGRSAAERVQMPGQLAI